MHGQFIQAAQKIPKTGQAIINMDQGGTLQPYTLQPQDQPVIQALETYCQHHQIQLAAIDLIQGKITDLNYTSPGLLVAMEALYQQNLAQHYFKLSPSHL
jgi:glutathione synthase/RimK-type ligase-like ATP-grasp enzyme